MSELIWIVEHSVGVRRIAWWCEGTPRLAQTQIRTGCRTQIGNFICPSEQSDCSCNLRLVYWIGWFHFWCINVDRCSIPIPPSSQTAPHLSNQEGPHTLSTCQRVGISRIASSSRQEIPTLTLPLTRTKAEIYPTLPSLLPHCCLSSSFLGLLAVLEY